MLTLEELKAIPAGKVFATGILPNNPDGLYMESAPGLLDRMLLWVAIKGYGYDDWSIYTHWEEKGIDWVKEQGDKVSSESNIQKCVLCTEEVLQRYRY